jgi:hypothetical protein
MIEQKPEELPLADLVRLHLVNAVQYGYITIRYEAGRPTCVERFEQVRLTGGREPKPA